MPKEIANEIYNDIMIEFMMIFIWNVYNLKNMIAITILKM